MFRYLLKILFDSNEIHESMEMKEENYVDKLIEVEYELIQINKLIEDPNKAQKLLKNENDEDYI